MLSRVLAVALMAVLGGCVSQQEGIAVTPATAVGASVGAPVPAARTATPAGFGWARSDGQRISGDAALTARARSDIAACRAESPPSSAEEARGEICMKGKGYYIRALD